MFYDLFFAFPQFDRPPPWALHDLIHNSAIAGLINSRTQPHSFRGNDRSLHGPEPDQRRRTSLLDLQDD